VVGLPADLGALEAKEDLALAVRYVGAARRRGRTFALRAAPADASSIANLGRACGARSRRAARDPNLGSGSSSAASALMLGLWLLPWYHFTLVDAVLGRVHVFLRRRLVGDRGIDRTTSQPGSA